MDYKTVIIVLLTAVFVVCHIVALSGYWTGTPNKDVLTSVAPIVSVIIGYYFGRLPSEKHEKEATQAQADKTAAVAQASALQQKINSAVSALSISAPTATVQDLAPTLSGVSGTVADAPTIRNAAAAALKVLQS
jgi:hypothetical protein